MAPIIELGIVHGKVSSIPAQANYSIEWYTYITTSLVIRASDQRAARKDFVGLINLFFPLAFFLLLLCLTSVILAFLLLDNARALILSIQRILGVWFGLFGVVFGAMLLLLIGLFTTGRITLSSSADLFLPLTLLVWNVAFTVLSAAAAYFLLYLWSSEATVDASGIKRKLAFGQDTIGRKNLGKIIEVAYLYTITKDLKELRTKSFFILVCNNRSRVFRYALFRPTNRSAEDSFRENVTGSAPLVSAMFPGLPRLPRLSFRWPGANDDETDTR